MVDIKEIQQEYGYPPHPKAKPGDPVLNSDRLMIDLILLLGISKGDAYRLVYSEKSKDITMQQAATRATSLLSYPGVDDYINERLFGIKDMIADRAKKLMPELDSEEGYDASEDIPDDLMQFVVKKGVSQIKSGMEGEAAKAVIKQVVKKLEGDTSVEPPRRYLPISRCDECRYYQFVEKEKEAFSIEDVVDTIKDNDISLSNNTDQICDQVIKKLENNGK